MSLGGTGHEPMLRNAVAAAVNAGSLIVASAGNDGSTTCSELSRVVSWRDGRRRRRQDGVLATYSNAGTKISVSAPGGDFRLDDNGGGGVLGPGWNFVQQARRI